MNSYDTSLRNTNNSNKKLSDETTPKTVSTPPVLTPERESLLFSKIDLDGAKEWSEELKV